MIGLLRNSYYGALGSAKVLAVFFAAAGVALLVSGNQMLMNLFGIVTATAFSANAVSGIRKEASTKWGKYELTTPVRRKDIIKSHYVTHILWVLVGILVSVAVLGLDALMHGNRFYYSVVRDPAALFAENSGIAMFTGAIYYPLNYILGTDRGEVTIILSFLGAVGLTMGLITLINHLIGTAGLSDAQFFLCMAVFLAVAVTTFLLSYRLSLFVYQRTEC